MVYWKKGGEKTWDKSLPKVSDRAIDWEWYIERQKYSVRCKMEHTFRIIKWQFCFQKIP